MLLHVFAGDRRCSDDSMSSLVETATQQSFPRFWLPQLACNGLAAVRVALLYNLLAYIQRLEHTFGNI